MGSKVAVTSAAVTTEGATRVATATTAMMLAGGSNCKTFSKHALELNDLGRLHNREANVDVDADASADTDMDGH